LEIGAVGKATYSPAVRNPRPALSQPSSSDFPPYINIDEDLVERWPEHKPNHPKWSK
jgi:hypothetical protein